MDFTFMNQPASLKNERLKSSKLPHRKERLEYLLLKMSLYQEYYSPIISILDGYKEELATRQDPDGRWKAMLQRMDRRNYTFEPYNDGKSTGIIMKPVSDTVSNDREHVVMSDDSAIDVWYWCNEILRNGNEKDNTIENWRKKYGSCRAFMAKNDADNMLHNAPANLATIGLIYYFYQLNDPEKEWCITIIIDIASYFLEQEKDGPYNTGLGKYSIFNKDVSIAHLPHLFSYGISQTLEERVSSLIVSQLHNMQISDGLSKPLFEKISKACWQHRPSLALQCFRSFVLLGSSNRPQADSKVTGPNALKGALPALSPKSFQTEYLNRYYLDKAYLMISECPVIDEEGLHFTLRYLDFLLKDTFQSNEAKSRLTTSNTYYDANWHFSDKYGKIVLNQSEEVAISIFLKLIGHFLVDSTTSIEHLTDKSIDFAAKCLDEIILYQDRYPSNDRFNTLWSVLAHETIQSLRPVFINKILLNFSWRDDASSWQAVSANPKLYKELIEKLGMHEPVSSIKLMSGIGFDLLFPDSINHTARIIQSEIISKAVNMMWLNSYDAEKYIQRSFFLHGNKIRNNATLRSDFIIILDAMVEHGSSIAYTLKENISSVNLN